MVDDRKLTASNMAWKVDRFSKWNGDLPAPTVTHWTPDGSVIVRAATVYFTTEVIWKPKDGEEQRLGYGPYRIDRVAELIARGEYDKNAGVAISSFTPADLLEWNDLAG